LRIGIQFIGVAVLPPANCRWNFVVSSGACSIFTFDQSASSSSAMIIGSIVFTPWPTSGFFAMIVIEPSGVMRMNALGESQPRSRCAGETRARVRHRLDVRREKDAATRARSRAGTGGDPRVSWYPWCAPQFLSNRLVRSAPRVVAGIAAAL
jgi:hypothetical protein